MIAIIPNKFCILTLIGKPPPLWVIRLDRPSSRVDPFVISRNPMKNKKMYGQLFNKKTFTETPSNEK